MGWGLGLRGGKDLSHGGGARAWLGGTLVKT